MDIYPTHHSGAHAMDTVLGTVALYKQVYQLDPQQFDVLMRHSQLLDARPGEVIIETGEMDSWLYFLLKGQLVVYAGKKAVKRVNTITPGEIFGDMAVLMNHPRTALVIADTRAKLSTVVRTDFAIFGEPKDLTCISLPIKLLFYRIMVHNLRWKLEVYRAQFPAHPFAADHRRIRLYTGSRGVMDELLSLDSQAIQLAQLLISWNLAFTDDD